MQTAARAVFDAGKKNAKFLLIGPKLPSRLHFASSVQVGETFYLVGGKLVDSQNTTWTTRRVHEFDTYNSSWTKMDEASSLSELKRYTTAFAVDSRLFPLKCPNGN